MSIIRQPLKARHAAMSTSWLLVTASVVAWLVPDATLNAAPCTQAGQNGCTELSASPPQDTVAIPPNIVLILDDSGSMLWDFMPDYGYITDTSYDGGLVSNAVNGVYYNPDTTYSPPPKADGTPYPNATFNSAWMNGFNTAGTTVDISTYRGRWDYDSGNSVGGVMYSTALPKKGASATAKSGCPSGWTASGSFPGWCYDGSTNAFNRSTGVTFYDMGVNRMYRSLCDDPVNDYYEVTNTSTPKGNCTAGISFFRYATPKTGGGYTLHFVGKANTCSEVDLPAGATCDDSNAARQNVANWFSYYHTRILMAKSGVMTAFSNLSANYRLGFGALNNRNTTNLPASRYTGSSMTISNVNPFGDGASGTIKAQFWNWLETLTPSGNTPLRPALNSAGKYYQTADPWTTKPGDPNYVAGGSNTDELACRSSYSILTTDGFWNSTDVASLAGQTNSDGPSYSQPDGTTGRYKAVPPFNGGNINSSTASIADVAAYYWKNDLRSSVANLVPTTKRDPAFWQHMTTFSLGIGWDPIGISPSSATMSQIFTWADQGGDTTAPGAIPGFSWPTPGTSSQYNIADLAHAGVVGHGDFFSAKNPEELATSFARAIAQIAERNIAPQPRSSNATVLSVGAMSFGKGYNTGNWSGSLEAVRLKANGMPDGVQWDIAARLDARSWSDRKAFTYSYTGVDCSVPLKPTGGTPAGGKVFDAALSGLDCWQQAGLMSPAFSDPAANGLSARVQFLLGNDALEGSPYRKRAGKLGAVIGSDLLYVSYPSENYRDIWPSGSPEEGGDSYSDYMVDEAGREGVLYVGANDGMLHAFSAPAPDCDFSDPANVSCTYDSNGGKELFSYVPRAVYANLGNLTDPDFIFRPTVDGPLMARDVYFGNKWRTILVGGTGLGGRGVFALDVSKPESFGASDVLWEFDSDMTPSSGCVSNIGSCKATDLGYTRTKPYIGRLANGKWVVLVSNGYFPDCNLPSVPTAEPENAAKPRCEAIADQAPSNYSALFVLDAETGAMIAELKTPSVSGVTSYGLGPVVLGDYQTDQIDDVAFAGDLMGNLWRFDLTDPNPSKWSVSLAFEGQKAGGKQGIQPITTQPRLFPDPWSSRFMVVFGTGKYLGPGDNDLNIPTQALYGIRDLVDGSEKPRAALFSKLKQQTLTETAGSGDFSGATMRNLTNHQLDASNDGWYINFDIAAAKGERVIVTPAAVFPTNGAVVTTLIPTTENYCDPTSKGAVMMVSAANGGATANGVAALGGGSTVGARTSAVPTSGASPIMGGIGGGVGSTIVPMPIEGIKDDDGNTVTTPIQLDAPVWRRRSWHEIDLSQ